jgi:pimeloyl-ACP methyl ester carboxylesterase
MLNAARTWSAQEELAWRWRLVLPDRRGFSPNPPDVPSDFERDADDLVDLLAPTAHVVGHSYGAVVALLMAAAAPDQVRSLTVVEPPVRQLARGVAEVEDAIARHEELLRLDDPDPVYRGMLRALGAPDPQRPLTELERRHVQLLIGERPPWEADLPLEALRAAGIPCLILTGGHDPVFELVADRLRELLAPVVTRVVLHGAGHAVQRAPGFNETVERFWCSARQRR